MHVRKLTVAVRLSQPQLAPRDGSFQLFPAVGSQSRPETVFELLNSSRSVIPFLSDEGDTLLLTRTNVDWVAIGPAVESRLIVPPGPAPTHEQRVELRFVDESRVDAAIRWRSPVDSARLSDHLNFSEDFLAARTGFGTLMVNKARVREMRIVGAIQVIQSPPVQMDLDRDMPRLSGTDGP